MEKYVGFWNNSSNEYPQFPMPVPTNAPAALRERIASAIAGLQEKADIGAYRGFSTCRICGENRSCLGHQEYKYLQYTEDFERIRCTGFGRKAYTTTSSNTASCLHWSSSTKSCA